MAQAILECDIAIIGGGVGGVAAALAAAEAGMRVVMSEPTDWIGGQVTAQLVAPLDEHAYMETFGGTRSYYRFREGVRSDYRDRYPALKTRGTEDAPLNPGSGWVSRLCYEPRVGLRVLENMLEPHVAAGRLTILRNHTPAAAQVRNARIMEVTLEGPDAARVALRASIYLDATELGDLLPLTGTPYVVGAEAVEDTGEPHASQTGPQPSLVQSFTYCFMVEYRPGENHTIRKPYGYDYLREAQPFTLVLRDREGFRRFLMFGGDLPFWTYRRVFDAGKLTPGGFVNGEKATHDTALINWDSNDYYKENIIDRSSAQQARILREARRLSLSFLYWLQTEAPHDNDKGRGFPGLMLLPQAAGTADGLAKAPYIREARRVLGYRRVLEQDVIAKPGRGARAAHYGDSVGIGWYPIDLHRCAGDPTHGHETLLDFDPSLPFQIPLGALLSPAVSNLVAAAKNISTTHITNGAYRLHPVEWAVGEAAGALAAYCTAENIRPRTVWETPEQLNAFQHILLNRGVPLGWTVDLGLDDPDFAVIQSSLLEASRSRDVLVTEGSPRHERLEILPDEMLSRTEGVWLLECAARAQENAYLPGLMATWQAAPLGPFTGADWRAACAALDLPSPESSKYPTLREVCRKLSAG